MPKKGSKQLYRVKPLEWIVSKNPDEAGERFSASTPFGNYYVESGEYRADVYGRPMSPAWSYCFDEYYDEGGPTEEESVDAAKAAAEAHWLERISPILESVK